MGIPPRHIGDSIDVQLLHEISKLLDRMEQIICCRFFTPTTTSTTTINELITTTSTTTEAEPQGLRLTFDSIDNAPVEDPSSVSDWNTFFDLPTNGNPFTSVSVEDNTVILMGGSGITWVDGYDELQEFINFGGNSHLISVDDKDECIVALGYGSFAYCDSATSFSFPAVTTAGVGCFEGCSSVISLNIPLLAIAGAVCFNGLSMVTSFDFPLLTSVGDSCFQGCSSATSFDYPLLIEIADYGFNGCTSATSFNFPILESLGTTSGDDSVFNDISGNEITLTIPHALMTCNDGDPDGDIQYLQDNNTVTIVYSD